MRTIPINFLDITSQPPETYESPYPKLDHERIKEWKQKSTIERQSRASNIIKNAREFCVCFGCESVMATNCGVCPNCHAYKFNDNSFEVSSQALRLSSQKHRIPDFIVQTADIDWY